MQRRKKILFFAIGAICIIILFAIIQISKIRFSDCDFYLSYNTEDDISVSLWRFNIDNIHKYITHFEGVSYLHLEGDAIGKIESFEVEIDGSDETIALIGLSVTSQNGRIDFSAENILTDFIIEDSKDAWIGEDGLFYIELGEIPCKIVAKPETCREIDEIRKSYLLRKD